MIWYDELPRWARKTVDQVAHFLAGGVISLLAGPIVSVVVAIVREIVQNWGDEDNDYFDMGLDVFVWASGAVIASLVF